MHILSQLAILTVGVRARGIVWEKRGESSTTLSQPRSINEASGSSASPSVRSSTTTLSVSASGQDAVNENATSSIEAGTETVPFEDPVTLLPSPSSAGESTHTVYTTVTIKGCPAPSSVPTSWTWELPPPPSTLSVWSSPSPSPFQPPVSVAPPLSSESTGSTLLPLPSKPTESASPPWPSQPTASVSAPSSWQPSGSGYAPSGFQPTGSNPSPSQPFGFGSPPFPSQPFGSGSPPFPPLPTGSSLPTPSGCTLPTSPLTNEQQVGNSLLGTLCQPPFPMWLGESGGEPDGPGFISYDPSHNDLPPWGDRTTKNSDATIKADVPNTGMTRSYEWVISRGALSPDGVLRDMITINNQFPGPLIEANWGDWIEVTVHNNITAPEEGTAIHWHGILQRETPWEDGVPSTTQCPIAPGQSYTYRYRAEIHGTSFYHAHYSAQYSAGVVGPIIIYGPSSAEYDIDVGPVMLSDWNHIPYFSMVESVVDANVPSIPMSDNALINGRGRWNCAQPSFAGNLDFLANDIKSDLPMTCVDGAEQAKFRFYSGKTHRLRLVNHGADGIQKFSIDGHQMTVIATDYLPVVPYTTDVITLGVGQRTDVLVTADHDPTASFWMRTELPNAIFCGGLGGEGPDYPQILGAIYYEDADTTVDPTSSSNNINTACTNDDLSLTVPDYPIAPSADPYIQDLRLNVSKNETGSYIWTINEQTFYADFNEPLLYKAAAGNTSFPDAPQWNVYDFGNNATVVLNVTNHMPFAHPFHLHGHNFYVLSVSGEPGAVWEGEIERPDNPMRRDVQIIPAQGYMAIQYEADNPGVWPFHCHAAWHLSGGLAMNIISRPDDILPIPEGTRESTCDAWSQYSSANVVDQIDSGS